MKVSAIVKSETLFTLLKRKIETIKNLPEIELLQSNSFQDFEDQIEFIKPEFYIVHHDMESSGEYINILEEKGKDYFLFKHNLEDLALYMIERYAIEEAPIDELQEELNVNVEKEKKEFQQRVIQKEKIERRYETIPFQIIIVGSLFRSSGSTILASNLARMVGERELSVAYVEHPLIKPIMYDYLQIHTITDEYSDLSRKITMDDMTSLKEPAYKQDGVNWHVIDSTKPTLNEFEYHNLLMLTHATDSNIVILDISDRWRDPDVQKLMRMAHLVLMTVEPDPIKLEYATLNYQEYGKDVPTNEYQVIKRLKEQVGNRFELVLMKDFKGKDIRALNEIYEQIKRPIASVPYFEYPVYHQALQQSKVLYDLNETIKSEIETNLLSVLSRFLPKDLVELPSKRKTLFAKFRM